MSEFTSITSRIAPLFNQPLVASLLQPLGRNQADYKAYRTKVNLKITEQRNESSGEKELRFEISKADDFEFLFAEILNNEKYQQLAREHDLIVDFDAFPRAIIQKLLCKNIANENEEKGLGPHSFADNKPTEITLILDVDKTTCLFELFSKTPISKGRIFSIKLSAVRGDQLTSHLLKICSNQAQKLTNYRDIMAEVEELREKLGKAKSENDRLKDIEEKQKQDQERIEELEDELELVKEERSNIRELVEEKDEEIQSMNLEMEEMKKEVEDLKDELEIVGKMIEEEQQKSDRLQKDKQTMKKEVMELRKQNEMLYKDVEKSKHFAKTYLSKMSENNPQQSVDMRKLKELEVNLREKDELIVELTETNKTLQQQLNDEKKKLVEVEQNMEQMKKTNMEADGRLQWYRRAAASAAASTTPDTYMSPLLAQANPILNRTPGQRHLFPTISSYSSLNSPSTMTAMGRTPSQKSPFGVDSGIVYPPTTPTGAFRNLTNYTNDSTQTLNTPKL